MVRTEEEGTVAQQEAAGRVVATGAEEAEVADSPGLVAAECAGHCLLFQASLTLLPVSDPFVLHQEHHVQANAAHQKQLLLLLLLLLQYLLTAALQTRLLLLHCVRA